MKESIEIPNLLSYLNSQNFPKTNIVEGNILANSIMEYLKKRIHSVLYKDNTLLTAVKSPTLVIVDIKGNYASNSYIKSITKKCEYVGIKCIHLEFDKNCLGYNSPKSLFRKVIGSLNKILNVEEASVIVPTPINWDYWFDNIDSSKCNKDLFALIESIVKPTADADGISTYNMGHLVSYNDAWNIPATPLAIDFLLKYYNVNIEHKTVTVIGRSNTVGKPIAHLMLNNNATVTVCSSFTPKGTLDNFIKNSDIVISCAGSEEYLITADNVKPNSVIIDASYTITNGKIHGDCDFDNVVDKVQLITPVPKGVGPITTCMLLLNVFNYWYYLTNKHYF